MAADELGGRLHHHVGPEVERALDDRGGERAVDHDQATVASRCGTDRGQIGNREQRVGRRLKPQQIGLQGGGHPGVGVGQIEHPHRPATLFHPGPGDALDGVVRIGGDHHRGADREPMEHAGGGRHAGPECERTATLQAAHQLLERILRGRALGAVVVALAGQAEVRRQHRGSVERITGLHRSPPVDDPRRRIEIVGQERGNIVAHGATVGERGSAHATDTAE